MSRYGDMIIEAQGTPVRQAPDISFEYLYKKNMAVKNYRETSVYLLQLVYPNISRTELEYVVDRAVSETIQYHPAVIDNSYKKTKVNTTLPELAHYILSRQPIITSYGVMFTKHGDVPNPIYKMIDSFIRDRDRYKGMMFQYPKGTFEYAKYNLLQQLVKIDSNAIYGSMGMNTCYYYNFYVAASVTAIGKSLNSAMSLFFESFLDNNVPFESLNELVGFIYNILHDKRTMDDSMYISHNASVEETFFKLMTSCGFNYIPTQDDLETVWSMVSQLTQPELNRLYYSNNLYEFCGNTYVSNLIIKILCTLETEWSNSNIAPDSVKPMADEFTELLREYVFYKHQIIDRTSKMDVLIRNVSIIQDTDSAIVSFDAWYRFILQKTFNVDMAIKNTQYDMSTDTTENLTYTVQEYDFFDDDLIEVQRSINPVKTIPQDQLRHSILSILSYSISTLLNDYMYQYCENANATLPDNGNYPLPKGFACMIHAKTEFLFKRILLPDVKKHYASYQELQEGNKIPEDEALDTKGMDAFNKSTTNDAIKAKLKAVLLNDIMNTPEISQMQVIKAISAIEKEIFENIASGGKDFFKPAKVKASSAYNDPMIIQGIKASMAYNALHEDGTESINLDTRNSIDIAKVDINPKNIDRIKNDFPEVYEKALKFMDGNPYFKHGIDSMAIPINEPVPRWLIPFIKYEEIVTDNVGKFPIEDIGICRVSPTNNKTNIVKF